MKWIKAWLWEEECKEAVLTDTAEVSSSGWTQVWVCPLSASWDSITATASHMPEALHSRQSFFWCFSLPDPACTATIPSFSFFISMFSHHAMTMPAIRCWFNVHWTQTKSVSESFTAWLCCFLSVPSMNMNAMNWLHFSILSSLGSMDDDHAGWKTCNRGIQYGKKQHPYHTQVVDKSKMTPSSFVRRHHHPSSLPIIVVGYHRGCPMSSLSSERENLPARFWLLSSSRFFPILAILPNSSEFGLLVQWQMFKGDNERVFDSFSLFQHPRYITIIPLSKRRERKNLYIVLLLGGRPRDFACTIVGHFCVVWWYSSARRFWWPPFGATDNNDKVEKAIVTRTIIAGDLTFLES